MFLGMAGDFEGLGRRFKATVRNISVEELKGFDEWFMGVREGLLGFCGGVGEGLTEEERQRLTDYLYMYALVHDTGFDERYDQPIFGRAIEYATRGRNSIRASGRSDGLRPFGRTTTP
jgi:hypothetical protein